MKQIRRANHVSVSSELMCKRPLNSEPLQPLGSIYEFYLIPGGKHISKCITEVRRKTSSESHPKAVPPVTNLLVWGADLSQHNPSKGLVFNRARAPPPHERPRELAEYG